MRIISFIRMQIIVKSNIYYHKILWSVCLLSVYKGTKPESASKQTETHLFERCLSGYLVRLLEFVLIKPKQVRCESILSEG